MWRGYRGGTAALVGNSTLLASEIAVRVVNGFISMLVPPRILPKLVKCGIPEEHTTMVVIPAYCPISKGLYS